MVQVLSVCLWAIQAVESTEGAQNWPVERTIRPNRTHVQSSMETPFAPTGFSHVSRPWRTRGANLLRSVGAQEDAFVKVPRPQDILLVVVIQTL